jgi:malate synthase
MNRRIMKKGYKVAGYLYNRIEHEVILGKGIDADAGIDADDFWQSMANVFDELTPKN